MALKPKGSFRYVPVLSGAEFAGIADHAKSLEPLVNAHLSLEGGYDTVRWMDGGSTVPRFLRGVLCSSTVLYIAR